MMSVQNSALADEISAVNAIFGDGVVVATFSDNHHTSLSLKFPAFGFAFYIRVFDNYPLSPPEVLGIDNLMESRQPEAQQTTVYFGACVRAAHYPEYACLFDAINDFDTVYRSLQSSAHQKDDSDETWEQKVARRANILRDLALRARARAGPDRDEYFTGEMPYDVVDCSSCLEPFFRVNTANLSCKHSLCPECLSGQFRPCSRSILLLKLLVEGVFTMWQARSELRCCGESVPVKIIRQHGGFEDEFLEAFVLWLQEYNTPNPTYCPWENCLCYIPRRFILEDYAKCPTCKKRMCMGCKHKEHGGMCRQDKKLKKLIEKQGWKFCVCGEVVERTYGCNHMTCKCKNEFCYLCGKQYEDRKQACGCGVFEGT